MNPHVRLLAGRSVGWLVDLLHFHAPIGALVPLLMSASTTSRIIKYKAEIKDTGFLIKTKLKDKISNLKSYTEAKSAKIKKSLICYSNLREYLNLF